MVVGLKQDDPLSGLGRGIQQREGDVPAQPGKDVILNIESRLVL